MNNVSNIQTTDFSEIGLKSPVKLDKTTNEKNQFLELFVAQLKNQNPLEPQDGSEFLAQLAQFSTVEGIKNLETSFGKLSESLQSNQALQATSLVGKKVHVKSDQGVLTNEGIHGAIEIPKTANNVTLQIINQAGETVKTYNLNAQQTGETQFSWNGLDDAGNYSEPGVYRLKAMGYIDGKQTALNTAVASNVDSVTIGKGGQPMTVNVQNYGKLSIEDIKTIS